MIWVAIVLVLIYLSIGETGMASPSNQGNGESLARALAYSAGSQYSLDPSLIYGVIMTESGGDPNASNPSDPSVGLMGVQAIIGRAYAGLQGNAGEVLSQLYDPATNLAAGCGFLQHLQSRYGDTMAVHEWIQAYNLGETKFDKGVRNPSYGDSVIKFIGRFNA